MKVYVTRDVDFDNVDMWYKSKPRKERGGYYHRGSGYRIIQLNARKFKDMLGFTPRKGSCKQYELTLKEIK